MPAGDVLLEDVVLGRARDRVARDALGLGRGDVERQQDRRRGVDRHRRADPVERQALEQDGHVGEAGDRHADPAHLPFRLPGVRVVAHLGRQVERDRQPGLALLEQVAEPAVGLLGGGEAGVLAHRPEAAPVHRRLDAPGERVLARAGRDRAPRRGRPRRPACTGPGSRSPTRSRTVGRRSAAPRSAFARTSSRQRSRPGSAAFAGRAVPGAGRRGPVARRSFEHQQEVPDLDRAPDARRPRWRRSRRAGRGARSASSSPPPPGVAGRPRPDRPAPPRLTRSVPE